MTTSFDFTRNRALSYAFQHRENQIHTRNSALLKSLVKIQNKNRKPKFVDPDALSPAQYAKKMRDSGQSFYHEQQRKASKIDRENKSLMHRIMASSS